jgi:hypothetical protein
MKIVRSRRPTSSIRCGKPGKLRMPRAISSRFKPTAAHTE